MKEFINWSVFLAVWISLAVDISSSTSFCRVSPGGGHSHIKACNTIYTVFAFSIFEWILFTVTFAGAVSGFSLEKQGLVTCQGPIINAKTEAENPEKKA